MAQTTPTKTPEETRPVGRIDSYFKITELGSTVWTEVRGGLVTFFAMSYIVVLNPFIIGTVADGTGNNLAGGDFTKIAAVTALVAGLLTITMGVVAKFPLALATGLGLNAFVAYSVASLDGMTWPDAMGILVLVLTGFREAVFRAVPKELKMAIGGHRPVHRPDRPGRRRRRPHGRPGSRVRHQRLAGRLADPGVRRRPVPDGDPAGSQGAGRNPDRDRLGDGPRSHHRGHRHHRREVRGQPDRMGPGRPEDARVVRQDAGLLADGGDGLD